MANETEMLYDMPSLNDNSMQDYFLGHPNELMNGFFGTEIVAIVFFATMMTFLAMRFGPRPAFLLGSWAGWITSLFLFGMGIVGSYQIIVMSVLVMLGLFFNWTGGQ